MEEREREVGRPLELMEVASDKQNNPSFLPSFLTHHPRAPSSPLRCHCCSRLQYSKSSFDATELLDIITKHLITCHN